MIIYLSPSLTRNQNGLLTSSFIKMLLSLRVFIWIRLSWDRPWNYIQCHMDRNKNKLIWFWNQPLLLECILRFSLGFDCFKILFLTEETALVFQGTILNVDNHQNTDVVQMNTTLLGHPQIRDEQTEWKGFIYPACLPSHWQNWKESSDFLILH